MLKKKSSDKDNIAQALGNMYYAIYIINFEKRTYRALKEEEYIKEILPKQGLYEELLDCLEGVIEKYAYIEFRKKFSIENMSKLAKQKINNFGGDYIRKFGNEYKWVNIQLLLMESQSNEVILVFQNIDDKKQKESEEKIVLMESIETIQNGMSSKNRFFANMSHDMRTPLNSIINLTKLAIDNIDEKNKVLDYINKIQISSSSLLDTINNILEVSKMEENSALVNNVPTNLTKKIYEELSIFEEQAKVKNKNLHINIEIKHDFVLCDWSKFRQILINILSNAFQYTSSNGNIYVNIKEIEGKFISKYEISISDDGIGMSREFLKKIYTPFEKETRFSHQNSSGTGLGMSIVQSNVQKLNGTIEIKSEPKKGTRVDVILPFEICASFEEKEEKKQELQDLSGKRILIVEDNILNMEISTQILQVKGVSVYCAYDGKQAVEIFEKSKPFFFDAILMDIQMPVMNGYEATRTIRNMKREDAKQIPIIAVTASLFADEILQMEKCGMNDYIGKPIDFMELQKELTKYMKR